MHRFARISLCVVLSGGGIGVVACNTGDSGGGADTTSGGEPGVDGSVGPDGGPVEPPKACTKPADCPSKICTAGGVCAAPSPTDGVKNGDESDVDCGGLKAPKCIDGKACTARADCANDVCNAGKCQPAICNDGSKNGTETDIDCGGAGCPRCEDLQGCKLADDCKSGVCKDSGGGVLKCAAPSPTDGVKNGTETDVDCGGGAAGTPKCAPNKACAIHADCASDGCAYTGKCAVGRSCTAKYGGDTCGAGGAGARGAANWESCCATAPAGAGGVAMGKYKVTSGRMRAFLERTKGNVRQFMADARVGGQLHGAPWNAAWEAYLPTAMDGCEQDGSCDATELSDHGYNDPTVYQGIYSSAYRHLGGTIFDGQSLGQQGCSVSSGGTHSYWMDAATKSKYFGDEAAEYAQVDYDPKPQNCVSYLMAQSFCVWDGGRLETQAEYKAAGGPVDSMGAANGPVPWGAPMPKGQASSTFDAFRFPTATDASLLALGLPPSDPNYKYIPQAGTSIEWATYLYSYEYPSLKTRDYIVFLSAPGRLQARSPNGHADLVGPLMEMSSDVNNISASPKTTAARWTANGSFEGHQWGYYGWNFSLLNKYGKQGLRCVYP